MNKRLTFTLLLIWALCLFGQPAAHAQDQITLNPPNVTPPSPTVSALQAPVNYPVNTNNGVPDISIPLYTIEVGKIKVPLVLRYHPANTKIDGSVRCNVAHGWTLEAGGEASRTIRNKPDERAVMYPLTEGQTYDQFYNYEHQKLLSRMYTWNSEADTDTEYDVFTYSFPGDNGSFFLRRIGNGIESPFEALFSPVKPYKMDSFTYSGAASRILTGFVIRGDNELSYHYGGALNNNQMEMTDLPQSGGNTASSWMLTRIEDCNGEAISFSYAPLGVSPFYSDSRWYRAYDDPKAYNKWGLCQDYVQGYYPSVDVTTETWSESYYAQLLPKEILFSTGKVVFSISGGYLNGFSVYNQSNTLLRQVVFNKTSAIPNNLLTSVSVKDINGREVDGYQISYSSALTSGYPSFDYWGYCNGTDTGNGPLPNRDFKLANMDGGENAYSAGNNAHRTPSETDIPHNLLSRITYKSGGSTSFDFEMNRFNYRGSDNLGTEQSGSGVRIRQIIFRDTDGSELKSLRYNYGPGHIPLLPQSEGFDMLPYYNIIANEDIAGGGYYVYGERVRRYTPKWISYVAPAGDAVTYEWVEEENITRSVANGKIKSFYSLPNAVTFSPVCANHAEAQVRLSYTFNHISFSSLSWEQSKRIADEVYDGQGRLVQKTSYHYAHTGNYRTLLNMGFHKFTNYVSDNYSSDTRVLPDYSILSALQNSGDLPYFDFPALPPLLYFYYSYSLDRQSLSSKVIETYSDGGTVREQVDYAYGQHYPREIKQSLGNDSYEVLRLKYPYDYTASQNAAAAGMISQNFISPVLEQERMIQIGSVETPAEYFRLNYAALSGGRTLYRPSELSYGNAGGSVHSRITYTAYDSKGNLTESTDANGITTAYIWGYNGLYLIAKGVNVSYSTLRSYVGTSGLLSGGTTADHSTVRNNCPNALIDFYEYKPFVGINKHIDPSGTVFTYSYNASGKLQSITDENGKLHSEYLYSTDNKQ